MTIDPRTGSAYSLKADEALIAAYLKSDDRAALETLLLRYLKPIQAYFRKHGRAKDDITLEQRSQDVVLAILEGLRNNRFTDTAPTGFARWVYTICRNICINANRKSLKVRTFSEVFPAEDQSPDPSVLTEEPDIPAPYEDRRADAERVMAELTPKDQKLVRLRIKENKSYEEIQQDDDFKKYSVDYLMDRMYDIRNKIRDRLEIRILRTGSEEATEENTRNCPLGNFCAVS